jgi:hypothetical protein
MCQKLERSNQLIWGYHADILVRLGYIIYKNLIRFLGVSENGGIVQETKTYSNMFVSKTLWIWHTLISWPSNQMSYVEWWESIGNFSEEPMRFWHLKESSNRNGWTWIAQYFKPREPQILPLIWGSVPESKLASRIIDQKNEPRRVTKKTSVVCQKSQSMLLTTSKSAKFFDLFFSFISAIPVKCWLYPYV